MATVHFGALVGEAGFSRIVAIKRLHTDRRSRQLVTSLLDEARLVSRVKHPNVVPILDVVTDGGEVLVVLEYVVGETLSSLLRASEKASQRVPIDYAVAIVAAALHGLHAAHEATNVSGEPLGIVHRDVSPQNIMVGVDGLARVLDFGIAKATERLSKSMAGQIKGKLAYMSPEQIRGQTDRRTDIYAAAVVLWELLAGRRLFPGVAPGKLLQLKIEHEIVPPSAHRDEVSEALDAAVMRGLAEHPDARFATAKAFAAALEDSAPPVRPTDVGAWVQELAGDRLARRARVVTDLEQSAAALTGEAPSFALSSEGAEVGGAFTEEVVSSDEPVAEEDSGSFSSAPTAPAALALPEVDDASDEGTALSAGMRPRDATHTEVVIGIPESESEEPTALSAGAGEISTSMGLQADIARRDAGRSKRAGAMVLFVLLGATAALLWFRGRREAAPAISFVDAIVAPAVPDVSSASESTPPPAASSASMAMLSASASASASSDGERPAPVATSSPTALPPWPPPTSPVAPPPLPPPPAEPRKDCEPPYVVDDKGVRRLKPECM